MTVWAVREWIAWEGSYVRSLHASKAGAWRAAHALRYEYALEGRSRPWMLESRFGIEPIDVEV